MKQAAVRIQVENRIARVVNAPAGWPFRHSVPVDIEVTTYDIRPDTPVKRDRNGRPCWRWTERRPA